MAEKRRSEQANSRRRARTTAAVRQKSSRAAPSDLPDEARAIRIRYVDPDAVRISYANTFYINHTEHEFVITLAEIAPPPVLHMTPDELKQLDAIEARVVSRIAMSPSRFQEFVRGVAENYDKWAESHGVVDGGNS